MGVPEKALFEDFLESFNFKIQISDIKDICQNNFSKKSVEKLLDHLDETYSEHYKNMTKHELNLWFKKQNNFLRAIDSLYLKYKPLPSKYKTFEDYKAERLKEVLEKLTKNKLMEYDFSSIEQILYYLEISNKADSDQIKLQPLIKNKDQVFELIKDYYTILEILMKWYKPLKKFELHQSIYNCFYNYFFTDRAARLHDAKIRSNKILRTLRLNLEEFSKLKEFDQFLFYSDKTHASNVLNNEVSKFERKIKNSSFIFPVDRNDETLKERVLIYELHKLFNQYFKKSKQNAIFYLLMVEGIKNNIEKRNIERMIAKWKNDI